MCLPVAVLRPHAVLNVGTHKGYEWSVVHNGMGYRCGYVKVPPGHPWYGHDSLDDVDVHGGITFAHADQPCEKGGPDDGFWVGFDCAHGGDAVDPALPRDEKHGPASLLLSLADHRAHYGTVRTQEYVEAECRRLCDQAAEAARLAGVK